MESILLKARLLIRAELVLVRLHMRRTARQATFIAVGIVSILLAVAMTNVAAFFFLSEYLGQAAAGLVLAALNGLLSASMFIVAARLSLGPEAQMASEIRDLAVAQLSADAQRIKGDVDTVKSDVAHIRAVLSSLRGGELLGLATLAPMVKMLTSALKSKKGSS